MTNDTEKKTARVPAAGVTGLLALLLAGALAASTPAVAEFVLASAETETEAPSTTESTTTTTTTTTTTETTTDGGTEPESGPEPETEPEPEAEPTLEPTSEPDPDPTPTVSEVTVSQAGDGSVTLVFVGYEDVVLVWETPSEALRSMTVDLYPQYILEYWHGVSQSVSGPLVLSAAETVRGYPEPEAGTEPEAGEPTAPAVSRTVDLPPSGDQLARVDVSQGADYSVTLVFVGYEDVALSWLTPAEALRSMTVDRYPQYVLEQRHGVAQSVSDPLVQSAADEVRSFFQPGGDGGGSLEESTADAGGREVRVIRESGSIQVVFGGGWEAGAFVYDSVDWALSDLVDGGYVESKLIEFFGPTPEEVRPALATARALVTEG